MREPAFWWEPAGLASGLLSPLGAIYGAVAAARMARPGAVAPLPVLCVGNLTLGGAGKTPTVLAVAGILQAAGRKPVALSRGYGGREVGPLLVDAAGHAAADVGDEPLLLARALKTVVARDRVAGVAAAHSFGADAVVMDDGFQNPSVHKDLSLIVVDGARGVGNCQVFPAGPLRAPLAAQLARAQALLVLGEGATGDWVAAEARAYGLPVFRGRLEPDRAALDGLKGKRVLAFAGIGDPEKFFSTLRTAGIEIGATVPFPDHHRYSAADAAKLIARAGHEGLALVTTEKDLARMAGQPDLAALAKIARTLPVTMRVAEEIAFRDWVLTLPGPGAAA